MPLPSDRDDSPLAVSTDSAVYRESMLEHVVTYFVAAKRSLTSIDHVQRAKHIVADARDLTERVAVASASNTFIRACVDKQLRTAQDIARSLRLAHAEDRDEFDVCHHSCAT